MADDRGSPARRLSQIFDPLSRLSEYTHQTSESASRSRSLIPELSHSTPSSPRLMPRRQQRVSSNAGHSSGGSPLLGLTPPQPPPRPHAALDALDSELSWHPDVGVNWQERCLELQLELHRSRSQATRVRDMLRDKLSELEQRVLEAESRAEEAEDKVRMMEQRLASADWTPSESTEKVTTLSTVVKERQQVITKLETEVEEQRQLRLQDAKQVEAKAARIKEWVTNKLRELEEQNQLLREQNIKCNQQLELLRNHIATQGLRASAQINFRNSLSLEVHSEDSPTPPPRPQSTFLSNRRRSESLESSPVPANHIEPIYSKVEPSSSRHRRHQSVTGIPIVGGPVPPTPSTVPQVPNHLPEMDTKDILSDDLAAAVESLVLLPTSTPNTTESDMTHDYAEIYTPSRERVPWLRDPSHCDGSTSSTNSGSLSEIVPITKPPTPPLHRFPSWEAKIYQVANDGLQIAGQQPENHETHNGGTTITGVSRIQHTSSSGYCDISVPVYATVKGRASQIRSMPFTGDSSDDSSDGEGEHPAPGTAMLGAVDSSTNTRATNSSSEHTDTSLSGGSASSPSKSVKTTSSLSPAKRSSSGSPSKSKTRAVSDTSFESGMSDDYAIPPDALSCDTTSIESSMPSLLMRVSSYMDSPNKRIESLEKTGHLAKLGGKLKTWRKRWFVLKNGILTYWKSQNDVNRKPQGQIVLDEICRITRAEGAATFEISTGKKTYYLTADSIATMEDWIRVLQNVQRRNATKLLLGKEDNKPSVQGWLTKVKNGHAKKCWCVLIGKMFLYFKSPSDTNPVGQINMRDARVEEVDHVSDSDSEERDPDGPPPELTIGIFPTHQGPTYLLFPGKQEKDNWLYHLTVVSGGGPSAGTQYEQLVQKLMEIDGDPSCVLWRHPQLLHSKENIVSPLTSLSSEALQAEAIKLFKCCQLFMSVAVDQAGIDYHVVLAQNALQQCLDVPELQTELMCALVKQTSRHTQHRLGVQVNRAVNKLKPTRLLLCATQSLFTCDSASGSSTGSTAQKGSPTSIQAPPAPILDCKTNPPTFSFVQGWQLLALAVSLFVPKNNRLLWYLKLHLNRNADSKTECGKYAAYCERALERTLQNGGREVKPSRMEVLSILLKNPYHHSLPHSIPVHMLNGTYQVVGFDGSTTIEEFLTTLNQEIGCRDSAHNGFTLFSDDPIEKDLEHFIDHQAKLCDVISKWETALREKGSGKFENTRVIQLTYKCRLYWRHSAKMETDRERLLLCYQVNQQVVQGRFPINKELSLELASLMAQIDFGEYNSEKGRGSGGGQGHNCVLAALDKFYPYRYRDALTPEGLKDIQERLQEKWISLKGRSLLDCVRIYLTCTRKWPFFGASLFQAKLKQVDQPSAMVWLAVAEDCVTILELATMNLLVRYSYTSVVTFGGCQDDFMLVVCPEENEPSQKLLFSLSKPKILELTLLIADYMNALGHALPGTPQMGTLTRNGSHRSVRSRPTVAGTQAHSSTGHNTLTSTLGHSTVQQPDILKSTPDHQITVSVQRTDSKKRTHLDSGVA